MIQIIDCEQGTPEWHAARLGIPTASEFKTLLGIKKDAREKVTRRTYLLKLAGEIITGEPTESYSNDHMDRGKFMEAEARDLYSFSCDADPQQVGFIRNGQKGCSPDSLIGDKGMLEIKTKLPHLLIDCLLRMNSRQNTKRSARERYGWPNATGSILQSTGRSCLYS